MSNRLTDKVAIITGGGSGIGQVIACAYAREGAHVVLAARTKAKIISVRQEIISYGRQALPIVTDVRDESSVQTLVAETLQEFGRIDILINNAGIIGSPRPVFGMPLEIWENVMATNLRGSFLCTKHVWRTMIQQKDGVIINIGSTLAFTGEAMLSAYGASKNGLIGFTKSVSKEGAPFNIRVNVICPGITDTPMLDNWKKQSPNLNILPTESVVGTAIYLASNDGAHTTGQVISLSSFVHI